VIALGCVHAGQGAAVSRPYKVTPARPRRSAASTSVASLLCIFLGGFGAHHLYLGRNVAALRCLLTFNYFGLGAPLDLLRMRRYVRELGAAEAALAAGAGGRPAGVKGVKGSEGDTSQSFAAAAKGMVRVEFGSRTPSWPQKEVNILIDSVTSH
jgi:TM2 domain-containing membrane protein YozV